MSVGGFSGAELLCHLVVRWGGRASQGAAPHCLPRISSLLALWAPSHPPIPSLVSSLPGDIMLCRGGPSAGDSPYSHANRTPSPLRACLCLGPSGRAGSGLRAAGFSPRVSQQFLQLCPARLGNAARGDMGHHRALSTREHSGSTLCPQREQCHREGDLTCRLPPPG